MNTWLHSNWVGFSSKCLDCRAFVFYHLVLGTVRYCTLLKVIVYLYMSFFYSCSFFIYSPSFEVTGVQC